MLWTKCQTRSGLGGGREQSQLLGRNDAYPTPPLEEETVETGGKLWLRVPRQPRGGSQGLAALPGGRTSNAELEGDGRGLAFAICLSVSLTHRLSPSLSLSKRNPFSWSRKKILRGKKKPTANPQAEEWKQQGDRHRFPTPE